MVSNVDDTQPEAVNPTTASVRSNMTVLGSEITVLQAHVASAGNWVAQAHQETDFTAGGSQTWTVGSGDVLLNRYMRIGTTLFWKISLQTTTVAGTPHPALHINLPAGLIANNSSEVGPIFIYNGTSWVNSLWSAFGNIIILYADLTQSTNWPGTTDNTFIKGFLILETTT